MKEKENMKSQKVKTSSMDRSEKKKLVSEVHEEK